MEMQFANWTFLKALKGTYWPFDGGRGGEQSCYHHLPLEICPKCLLLFDQLHMHAWYSNENIITITFAILSEVRGSHVNSCM